VVGLDGNRHVRKGGQFFTELIPAAGGVVETKIGHRFAASVQDDDIVMVFSPIESGIVFDFISCSHSFCIVGFVESHFASSPVYLIQSARGATEPQPHKSGVGKRTPKTNLVKKCQQKCQQTSLVESKMELKKVG
jgi:hypothetical protein